MSYVSYTWRSYGNNPGIIPCCVVAFSEGGVIDCGDGDDSGFGDSVVVGIVAPAVVVVLFTADDNEEGVFGILIVIVIRKWTYL